MKLTTSNVKILKSSCLNIINQLHRAHLPQTTPFSQFVEIALLNKLLCNRGCCSAVEVERVLIRGCRLPLY